MTKADVEAHQARHGFSGGPLGCLKAKLSEPEPVKLPKPRQNATEREYGLILEAMKRKGEVLEYRFEGIKLAWGADPATGKPMYYTPDFYVVESAFRQNSYVSDIRLLEIKGPHIYPQDWIRFKGCRSEWPMFRFELHQKTSEGWRQLL